MQFIFIDEVEQHQKNEKFFGLGAVILNYYSYKKFKDEFISEFEKMRWDKKIEFKGKYLFSKSGDKDVSVDKRINFVRELSKMSISKKNSRFTFLFCYNYAGNSEKNYLKLFAKLVSKIKPKGGGAKSIIAIFVDENKSINRNELIETLNSNKNKKVNIFERPYSVVSDNNTIGIITVDVLCYLKSWIELSPRGNEQLKLFGGINETDKEKIKIVKEIVENIKSIKDIEC
jgi:hypothetical protein